MFVPRPKLEVFNNLVTITLDSTSVFQLAAFLFSNVHDLLHAGFRPRKLNPDVENGKDLTYSVFKEDSVPLGPAL